MVSLRKALIGINLFIGFGTLIYYQINGILKELSVLNTVEAYLRKNNLSPLSTHLHTKDDLEHWTYLKGVNKKEIEKSQGSTNGFIKNNEISNVSDEEDKEKITVELFKRKCKKLLARQIYKDKEASAEYVTAAKWCVKAKTVSDKLQDEKIEVPDFSETKDEKNFWESKLSSIQQHEEEIRKVKELIDSKILVSRLVHSDAKSYELFCFVLFQQRSLEENFDKYLDLSKKICVKK